MPLQNSTELALALAAACLLALVVCLGWLRVQAARGRADFERMRSSEERYRTLFEFTTDGVICHGADGCVVSANPAAQAILGLAEADLCALGPWQIWRSLCDADGLALAAADMPVVQALAQARHVKDTIVGTRHWQSGAQLWLQLESIPLWRSGQSQPNEVIAVFMDVTENRRSEDRFRVIVDSSPNALLMFDPQGTLALANAATQRVLGYAQQELLGQSVDLLLPGVRQAQPLAAELAEHLARHKDGHMLPVDVGLSPISTAEGPYTLATVVDTSARRQAEQAMVQLAYYDVLTGLPNRRKFIERLQHALLVGSRHPRFGALLFLDVDNFKAINDTIGHDAGDLMLQDVAARLLRSLRDSDSVARIGGDEFVVLLEELDATREGAANFAQDVAHKIRMVLCEPYMLQGRAYAGSVSIGVALWGGGQAEDVGELLKRSDMAMYDAKRGGRNAVRFFDPRMQQVLEARMQLEADLRQAIAAQQFVLFFQLRVLANGSPQGAEALLRWQHPARGLVPPMDFIPLAEETGLIVPIGRWVLQAACQQLQRWSLQPATRGLNLSVNISAAEFKQGGLVEDIRQMLQDSGANPALLELELTESLLFENPQACIATMEALRALGLRFALDDFGTGYSSLSYLQMLPLSTLKIDKSFVKDIEHKRSDASIVQTIIRMGQTLGLAVIAEGVETEAQRAILASHGCAHFQGYLFGRPQPLAAFEAALQAQAAVRVFAAPDPATLQAPGP